MSVDAESAQTHALGWRLATTSAVTLVMVVGFIGGSAFATGSIPTWQQVGTLWLLWFGFQAICLLLGFGWEWICKMLAKPARHLLRKWSKLRVHLRRRWIGDRTRDDYQKAEAGMIWPVIVVAGIILCLTSFGMMIAMLIAAVTLFMAFIVIPYYRDAPDKPMSSIIFAAIFSCAMGYVMTIPGPH